MKEKVYDYIIIGSGFGGSVSALRLSEKGYKVLVIEKGKWFKSDDFPKSNWNIKKWLWIPALKFYGFFKITFYKHIGILSGVGVGGGSLVYANTLPVPGKKYFEAESWAHLADWKTELAPFYETAKKMLGVSKNPREEYGDKVLKEVAKQIGKEDHYELTDVAIYFGEPNITMPDPYFGGEGPERSGCNFCGGCMVGCRYNAKNTLDKNYLHLALKNGAEIKAEAEVIDVNFNEAGDEKIYNVTWQSSTKLFKKRGTIACKGVIFAGGVLGTVPLLLKLKQTSLPNLSDQLGCAVRTNSESLLGVTAPQNINDFSKGIAISSIVHTDEFSHIEPVRYSSGSGFWRLQVFPLVSGKNLIVRIIKSFTQFILHPVKTSRLFFVADWAKKTQILLFMQTINSTLKFEKGWFRMRSKLEKGKAPSAFIPEARNLAKRFADIVNGTPGALLSETILGIPTTAHILGGCVMGKDIKEGVVDKDNKIFGYENIYVCDGSMISANPGVNPSLTITALAERAMHKIPRKDQM
ncbi:MAG: GMC family oxidoreductase [Ignavibacteriae bacterium HGW-Ignavibacteriae-2]|jgi:cholesterol oxidase|nr:MAG: GMC family oxidoreductase [Ignavibacteriae bacterium HGW-Ignavibacteriae-2]